MLSVCGEIGIGIFYMTGGYCDLLFSTFHYTGQIPASVTAATCASYVPTGTTASSLVLITCELCSLMNTIGVVCLVHGLVINIPLFALCTYASCQKPPLPMTKLAVEGIQVGA
jgi:hypothetical protein